MINIEKHKEEWEKNGMVVIPNFVSPTTAELLYAYYSSQTDDWWDTVVYPDDTVEDDYKMGKYKTDSKILKEKYSYLLDKIHQSPKDFSYRYRRHTHHQGVWTDCFPDCLRYLDDPNFLESLSYITGHNSLELLTMFTSNYTDGDYNGTHTDSGSKDFPRKVAFIHHLTKNWDFSWGGLFLRFSNDYENVIDTLKPKFNTMVLLDVLGGAPHCVTHVSPGVKSSRIALTGWYT